MFLKMIFSFQNGIPKLLHYGVCVFVCFFPANFQSLVRKKELSKDNHIKGFSWKKWAQVVMRKKTSKVIIFICWDHGGHQNKWEQILLSCLTSSQIWLVTALDGCQSTNFTKLIFFLKTICLYTMTCWFFLFGWKHTSIVKCALQIHV